MTAIGIVIAAVLLLDGFHAIAKALREVAAALREEGRE